MTWRATVALALFAPLAHADGPANFTPEENSLEQVQIHGVGWSSPRGVGDLRVKKDQLDAAPHQQTPEMLSAAPGYFVDHEDGEGLGNDVHLRGFDLEHGAGIELRVGSVPLASPHHILGPGYSDATFVLPEVVRGVRVLEGVYDPRQGDAAIAGSAYFDLGVLERGAQLKTSLGSFDQARVLGIVAPRGEGEETFAAFAVRNSNGFGERRASQSASFNAQWGVDLGPSDHLRFLATAYDGRSELAGVVRQDDVDAGRIGFDDSYDPFGRHQSVQSARVLAGADFDHETKGGGRFELEPWATWTDLRALQNATGSVLGPRGDLFDSTNTEAAAGLTSRYHAAPLRLGRAVEIVAEPGVSLRAGHTDQARSLISPIDLALWDRRVLAGLEDLDAGAYVDLDVRIAKRVRISGGLRADALAAAVHDALTHSTRGVGDVFVGPRITAEVEASRALSISASYGEGFRSADVVHLAAGADPWVRARSVEVGLRAQDEKKRFTTTLAVFDTFTDSELVFDADSGGLEPEGPSTRRGVVGSIVARPNEWLLASAALSINDAEFTSPGDARFVPSVAPILLRIDASAHRPIARVRGESVVLRAGVGYTYLAGAHLTDAVIGPDTHALNASLGVRWQGVEVDVEGYNVLNLEYADDAEVFASNWSTKAGARPTSTATHVSAAPPATVIGTLWLHF